MTVMSGNTEGGLRFTEFYDPNKLLGEQEKVVDYLLASRPLMSETESLGRIATGSIVLAESLHANLIGELPSPGRLGMDARHYKDLTKRVDLDVDNVVAAIHATIDSIQQQEQRDGAFHKSKNGSSEVVFGGQILAALASSGQKRESGRDYFQHPHEVASIIAVAAQNLPGLDPSLLDSLLFLAYCHDAYEDTFSRDGDTHLAAPVLVSPRVASRFLESVGVEDHYEVAHSLMLLSKPVGPDGKMSYMDYIVRGLHDKRFVLAKLADTHHNEVIEPKIAKGDADEVRKYVAKRDQYHEAQHLLMQAANKFDDINLTFLAHFIVNVDKRAILRQVLHQGGANHHYMAQELAANVARFREETSLSA